MKTLWWWVSVIINLSKPTEYEFEQSLGVDNGQESLARCSPWGHKESGMTERLNWTELIEYAAPKVNPNKNYGLGVYLCVNVGSWITTNIPLW